MKPLFIDTGITDQQLVHIKKVDTSYLNKPFHFHPNCELVYIQEGYGKRVIGDNVSTFNEGDLVLMGPNLPHIWTNDDVFYKGDKHYHSRAVVVYFSPALLDPILQPQALAPVVALIKKSMRGLVFTGRTQDTIAQALSLITEEDGLPQFIRVLSVLHELSLSREMRYISSNKFVNTYNERDTDRINGVYQFLMQHFKQDIHLEEVANIAHMAPTAFCRFFKQRTQKTFSHFLNELRVRHACELLNNPEKTISEISYESGYHNLTNFNKFFKEITGLSPSQFRKKL